METIELYTRPGCPYCMMLRRRLRKRGIEFRDINIWKVPEARARVRAVADGNETVPTVHVGDRWLVNPSIDDVADQLHRIADAAGVDAAVDAVSFPAAEHSSCRTSW